MRVVMCLLMISKITNYILPSEVLVVPFQGRSPDLQFILLSFPSQHLASGSEGFHPCIQ